MRPKDFQMLQDRSLQGDRAAAGEDVDGPDPGQKGEAGARDNPHGEDFVNLRDADTARSSQPNVHAEVIHSETENSRQGKALTHRQDNGIPIRPRYSEGCPCGNHDNSANDDGE